MKKLSRHQKAVKDDLQIMSNYLNKYSGEQITQLYCKTYDDFITPEMKTTYQYGVMSMTADKERMNFRKWLYRKMFEFNFNKIV